MMPAATAAPSCFVIRTPHLGEIEWWAGSELFLPAGLPGFENEKHLLPVEVPAHRPLVFLQSVARNDLCFVSLPVRTICPSYELLLSEDDRAILGIEDGHAPQIGEDVLCLALLLPSGSTVHVNLNAPIVVNLHNARCVQCLAGESEARYRLGDSGDWEPAC